MWTKNILTALNYKLLVGGLFCGLQKAFDSVKHYILLSKMEFNAISGEANNLIKSYFQGRYHRVLVELDSIENTNPNRNPLQMEIPGILAWPLLFLLYINDLPNVISDVFNPLLYADYSSLIITNSRSQMFERDINTAMLQLNRWLKSNLYY